MSDQRTDPQGDRCPHIPAALAATYPLRCFAPQWARFDNRQKRPAYQPLPSHSVSGSGVSALFVSDGDSFAPRRERFICLRRPHFFQQRKKRGKERRQKLRFCTSSARYTQQRFPAHSRGHSPLLSLSVKRTACTLTGAEASAAACPSHGRRFLSYRRTLKPSPLMGRGVE